MSESSSSESYDYGSSESLIGYKPSYMVTSKKTDSLTEKKLKDEQLLNMANSDNINLIQSYLKELEKFIVDFNKRNLVIVESSSFNQDFTECYRNLVLKNEEEILEFKEPKKDILNFFLEKFSELSYYSDFIIPALLEKQKIDFPVKSKLKYW